MTLTSGRYAAVTSTLALVIALGGTSYAATQIGTAQIKADAVTSPKIKDGTVVGRDVRESSLATVPSATRATRATKATRATSAAAADRATLADSAADANGIAPSSVFLATETSVDDKVVFSGAGLTITASCDAPNFSLDLEATTTEASGFLSIVAVADSNPNATLQNDFENGSLPANTPIDLLLGDDGDTLQSTFIYSTPSGSVVTGELATDVGNPTCSVRGTVFTTVSR